MSLIGNQSIIHSINDDDYPTISIQLPLNLKFQFIRCK